MEWSNLKTEGLQISLPAQSNSYTPMTHGAWKGPSFIDLAGACLLRLNEVELIALLDLSLEDVF